MRNSKRLKGVNGAGFSSLLTSPPYTASPSWKAAWNTSLRKTADDETRVDRHLVKLQHEGQAGPAGVVEGQQEDAEHPGRTAHQAGDHAPQALLLIVQLTVSQPVWKSTHSVKCKTSPDTASRIDVDSLTYDTPIEHPGSHQQQGQHKEDEVVMVPRSWNRWSRQRWENYVSATTYWNSWYFIIKTRQILITENANGGYPHMVTDDVS